MARNPRIRQFIRHCYRALIMVTSLAVVVGLAMAAPAQAASSSRSATADAMARQAAAAYGATAITPPSGNVTIDVDPGISYDPTAMQQLITQVQGENAQLSDSFKRLFNEYSPDLPAGTAGASDFTTGTDWQDFDGTLSMDSDDTGLSVTIPAAEVQTSATFWQNVAAIIVGGALLLIIRTGCVAALVLIGGPGLGVAGKTFCVSLANFIGVFVRGWMLQAWDGTTGDAGQWALTVTEAILAATPSGLWEAGINSFAENTLPVWLTNFGNWVVNTAVPALIWFGSAVIAGLKAFGNWVLDLAAALPGAVRGSSAPTSASGLSCDIYSYYGTPCVAAYSMDRALYSSYDGPLYQVQRASDGTTDEIGLLSAGGYVDASEQDAFCANTTCTVTKIYDQSSEWNDLTIEGSGGNGGADSGADATALPITIDGNEAYGLDITPGTGYRDDSTQGIATDGDPEGMYMVASGTNVNSGCCFDFGNAETDNDDNGAGHMDAVNLATWCGSNSAPCTGSGPWVEADMENGQWMGDGSNPADTGNSSDFVTAMLANNGQTTFELEGASAQSGSLTTYWDGSLPSAYQPMDQEGAVVLGTGGDNSHSDVGSFFEGVMTAGVPSQAAENAVQANIVSADYAGNSGGTSPSSGSASAPSAAGPAVVHSAGATGAGSSGFSSVYTVDSANGDLQETYLPYMGDSWTTQNLSVNYGTPPVMPGTEPVAIVHCGYTSVYTVDASNGDLQETYLPAIGDAWSTQDLSANYGTPPTDVTPTAVVHSAGATGAAATCGFTSVYTIDTGSNDLQETYLPIIGGPWNTQNLSVNYGTPAVQAGTSPVAIVHCGFTSVYTVDADHQLQETYLPAIGDAWSTQSLSANYGTPLTTTTPTAVVHSAGATGAAATCGFTSVYTVDQGSNDLQETYLPIIGGPWTTQNLSANYGTPAVAPGTTPVALVHMGFTSVYTVDEGSDNLQETYLPAIGGAWSTQSLSANYGTPATAETPIVLLHPDASGVLDWTSVYTLDESNDDLQETYLSNVGFPGDAWVTQNLSAKYGTPEVSVPDPTTAGWSVDHDGYTSVYTVDDSNGDLQETYLPAMGDSWSTQNLSANYGTPQVMPGTEPVAVVHAGYTSVYTIDSGSGDLQETYLPAIGGPWYTQNLSAEFGTPASDLTPAAVYHDGFTSVYTVDDTNGHLWETYLPAIGDPWNAQDLSANYGTPAVDAFTSPVAIVHDGFTSVYTVDASTEDLQETYLSNVGFPGDAWVTQNLSVNYGTPTVDILTAPTAIVHNGYTSVYTVDAGSGDLQETYLPAIGDAWSTQNLSVNYGTPVVAEGIQPEALYHDGFTSVYTVDNSNGHLQETYLPAIGDPWSTQDLSANYGTPVVAPYVPPSPLVHYDASGGLTWTSVYSLDYSNGDLQETYLPAVGDRWTTQNLSANYGTPPGI